MKILTITIPSYNVEKYLPDTIPTFLQPEIINDIEILIVNDGSKDDTAKIATGFCEKYPGSVFLINKENGGHGSTINKGIEYASGKYFRVVDGDDWVEKDAFISYVQCLKKLDSDLILTPFNRVYENDGTSEVKEFPGIEFDREYMFNEIVDNLGDYYTIHSATFKTELIKKIPAISENCFYVDQEYVCYAVPLIKTVTFIDKAVYQYRLGSPGQSVSKESKIKNRNMHKHVTINIITFYENADTSYEKKVLLRRKAVGLITYQMNIYFNMKPSKTVKREMIDFMDQVKSIDAGLFNDISRRSAKMMWNSNGRLYWVAMLLWKVKNNE